MLASFNAITLGGTSTTETNKEKTVPQNRATEPALHFRSPRR